MNAHQQSVAEFHRANLIEDPKAPTLPNYDTRIKRVNLILEELLELAHDGFGIQFFIGGVDSKYLADNIDNMVWRKIGEGDIVQVADACGDIEVVTHGTNLECGIDGEPVFAEIMRANMSKLGEDGKPVLREDGKILKGPNYAPPDVASEILRQTGAQPEPVEAPEPPGPLSSPEEAAKRSPMAVPQCSTEPEEEPETPPKQSEAPKPQKPGRNR